MKCISLLNQSNNLQKFVVYNEERGLLWKTLSKCVDDSLNNLIIETNMVSLAKHAWNELILMQQLR